MPAAIAVSGAPAAAAALALDTAAAAAGAQLGKGSGALRGSREAGWTYGVLCSHCWRQQSEKQKQRTSKPDRQSFLLRGGNGLWRSYQKLAALQVGGNLH
ncbi:MAG: hypothetical protein APF80_08565 [Alphaproteobacteria bacterium BRH_c36]|nr:MAG: hypothetical protein APF80_08565 [Alphaproteobacteria bacterium BRH_c36]